MRPRVSTQMNEELTKVVSEIEIKEAIFKINPTKAPGPDGMSALFFQKFWHVIKEQFVKEVQLFFEKGSLPREWNYTHLCLIPKTLEPKTISDLRPISLCSVIYKTVSKIMVKRLKPWMKELISNTQSAFVTERQIFDNITVAHEMIHSLDKLEDNAVDQMVVKTDMSKAYDRVEWSYLRSILCALGFDVRWINWIMKCVTSVTYSVLINDQAHGMISPQRGLRQGDSLSPLLFVLCTEGLSHLLRKAESERRIEGIKFGGFGPSVNHMLFADDCLFACKADDAQSSELRRVLTRYEGLTGQVINPEKSSIIFGKGVLEDNKIRVKHRLGIEAEGGGGKYLGLPEVLKGSKIKTFSYLKEFMSKKVSGWHARTLSQGGKEVLLKAVGTALPVHAMSVYKIPKMVISSLHSVMASFWWSNVEYKRKIHWMSWDKLCLPKEIGGMGFKDLECFNQALLARQGWRIIQFEDSLLAQVLKGKYFENDSFIKAQMGSKPSYAWRSLMYGRELLKKGLKHLIGDGRSVKVWSEPWIEDEGGLCRAPARKQISFDVNLGVSELIDYQKRRWNHERLGELFISGDVNILMLNQPAISEKDSWVWRFNKSGAYSVCSGYEVAFSNLHQELIKIQTELPSINPLKAKVWSLQAPSKIKIFIWKALSGSLSVLDNLRSRGMKCDLVCQTCGNEGESINHVLFSCTLARQVWAVSEFPTPQGGFHEDSVYQNMSYLITAWSDYREQCEITKIFPWTLWYLWKNRNSLLFEGFLFDGHQTYQKAYEEANLWLLAQNMEVGDTNGNDTHPGEHGDRWKPQEEGELKCNIGMRWKAKERIAGAVWVLRNASGEVLLHSRRSFGAVGSKDEAYFLSLAWAIESMFSHKCWKVYFVLEGGNLVNAINRPKAWPSFIFKVIEIKRLLREFLSWRIDRESYEANRGARLIADSAVHSSRFQSYVGRGFPRWLSHVFDNARVP
ncbi:uncharacterized protein LOC106408899 [Brassica napus]|uniref:uncharacterized protein LOC106408899 n=1 Tax=Brassica napus TaxID=3708 RepID=UPI0006AA65A8|nr:uncharacterized protein LOC106408899 [Brassica napus]